MKIPNEHQELIVLICPECNTHEVIDPAWTDLVGETMKNVCENCLPEVERDHLVAKYVLVENKIAPMNVVKRLQIMTITESGSRLFADKITTAREAREFLVLLTLMGWQWHPEDDPGEVADPKWDESVVANLRSRMTEVNELLNDPCGFILDFDKQLSGGRSLW